MPSPSRPDPLDVIALPACAVVSLRHYPWLSCVRAAVLRTLNANTYGALPPHVHCSARVVTGGRVWPGNPASPGEALRYPFGVDLFTAMLVKVGVPLGVVLPALGLAGAAAFAYALFAWGRGFAVVACLFSRGLAGFAAL